MVVLLMVGHWWNRFHFLLQTTMTRITQGVKTPREMLLRLR